MTVVNGEGEIGHDATGLTVLTTNGNRRVTQSAGTPTRQFVTFTENGGLPSVLKAPDQWPFFIVAEQEIETSSPE